MTIHSKQAEAFQQNDFVLNCSRVPMRGGLASFATELVTAASCVGYKFKAIVPAGFPLANGIEGVETPASLAGASDISLMRPLRWFAYSYFNFPVPDTVRILSTTHHVLPNRDQQIVTVHDLRPYFIPDNPVQAFYFRQMLPRLLRRCDGVITVSETSRQLLEDVYKLSPDRLAVVPNVIRLPPPSDVGPDLLHPYLLVVGASWPFKNVESLLLAHSAWASHFLLRIVAGEGQYSDKLKQLAQQYGISHRVSFQSNVSAAGLHELYQRCSAVVVPSRAEGFGLPAMEGMAHGRPAIVADIPVFHELYGNHAIYVQTEDISSWGEAMTKLGEVTIDQLNAARDHAGSFNQNRMQCALRQALHRFWDL